MEIFRYGVGRWQVANDFWRFIPLPRAPGLHNCRWNRIRRAGLENHAIGGDAACYQFACGRLVIIYKWKWCAR